MIYAAIVAACIIVLAVAGYIWELRRQLKLAEETIRTQKRMLDEWKIRFRELVDGLGNLLGKGKDDGN